MSERSRDDDSSTDEGPSTTSLPEDLLSAIFSKLDVAERARASRVCRRWRTAALQPPHNTELKLSVLLTGQAGPSSRNSSNSLDLQPEEAAAVLRGPLCGGLQRLWLACTGGTSNSALGTIGAALPPTLLALSLSDRKGYFPSWWRDVLAGLNLARNAPRLDELDLHNDVDADFAFLLASLKVGHPSLRRLGARFEIEEASQLASALRRLPRLKVLGSLDFTGSILEPDTLAALAEHGVRLERLELRNSTFAEAHARLLQPGAVLALGCSGRLPGSEGWTLPAGLAELRLDCSPPPTLFESLLCCPESHAPGLGKLVIRNSGYRWILPGDVVAALGRLPGGTQIELEVPTSEHPWDESDFLASLARTLAGSPTLHRFAHVSLGEGLARLRQQCPAAADDFAAYRVARAAALRGMGAEGRKLLTEQGYDR